MGNQLRTIDVDGLRIGMYVSQLDRPWLETPFLFQGFFIRNESEIEEIRRYCDYIEIDIEESDATILNSVSPAAPARKVKISGAPPRHTGSIWRRIRNFFRRKKAGAIEQRAPGEFYENTVSTADELVVAKSAHSGALDKVMNALAAIRRGE